MKQNSSINTIRKGETATFTKVVTQFVQVLSDNRTVAALDEQVSVVEEEDMELTG